MIKKAWAVWKGGIKDGGGTISTETGVLKEAPYEAKTGCPVSKLLKAQITMDAKLEA